MKLKSRIFAAAMGAAALLVAAPAFAAFDYNVTYTDGSNVAAFPNSAAVTTTNALTFFTVSPGGSTAGSSTPTSIGLFSLMPVSTAPSGTGPFALNSVNFTTTVSLQTVANLDGSGPIGSPAVFNITGQISGSLGPDSDATVISGLSGLPTTVTAGGITYAVSLDSIRDPGVVSADGNTGGVTLHIAAVPEPASLSMLGLSTIGLLARRRK